MSATGQRALAGLGRVVALPLSLLALALAGATVPGVFAGGGTRRWGRGRLEELRAQAQEAKDGAAATFYELDTAQRDLRITIETISAADDSAEAAGAAVAFRALSERVDQVSQEYITVVDAHDLDSGSLDAAAASRAQREFYRVRDSLRRTAGDLERFAGGLTGLVARAESQLAQVAPAAERARQALREATAALDAARAAGFRAEELASSLAALGPSLRLLNEGAGQHGIRPTIQRAEEVRRQAHRIAVEAERLPHRAGEIDRRLSSLRTRTEALTTRAGKVEPVLSELRRRFSVTCWKDLQQVPDQAAAWVRQVEDILGRAREARQEQRFADATARLAEAHKLLGRADEAVSAAGERLRRLNDVSFDHGEEIDRTRFVIKDAQRLAMSGRTVPDPRHARPLDAAVERLERAVADLETGGRNPDYWLFLNETEAVRGMVAAVVADIRGRH